MNRDIYESSIDLVIEECERVLSTLKSIKSDNCENSYFRMVFCSAYCEQISEFCKKYIFEFDKEKENEKK